MKLRIKPFGPSISAFILFLLELCIYLKVHSLVSLISLVFVFGMFTFCLIVNCGTWKLERRIDILTKYKEKLEKELETL